MPRLSVDKQTAAVQSVRRNILAYKAERLADGVPVEQIATALGFKLTTMYERISDPSKLTLSEYQMKTITACLRGVNDFPKRIYYTCNPGGQGHGYIKRIFIDKVYDDGEDGDSDLANYLDNLTENGVISAERADDIYAKYMTPVQVALKDREWSMSDDGGINFGWGIDRNGVVKDQYGNKYTLAKLVTALEADGMSKEDAKEYVKNLQKKLGI